MSLVILGQSGGPTQLSANDDVFGLMTQVPSGAVKHSDGGLTNGDGASAFGVPFNLLVYATHSTTYAEQTTTKTFATDDLPYKLRVLGVKVRCVAGSPENFREGYGFIRLQVEDGDGSGTWSKILNVEQLGEMEAGDVREFAVVDFDNAVVDADEGLRIRITSKADSFGTNPTASFIAELQCLRVL